MNGSYGKYPDWAPLGWPKLVEIESCMHLYISSAAFLSACVLLIGCTGTRRDTLGSSLHPRQIWSFTSTTEITNAFRGPGVKIDRVGAGEGEFMVVSDQYRSTGILNSLIYQRFESDFWHCRGMVSSYSHRDLSITLKFSAGVLSLYRDNQLQAQFSSTFNQEMAERRLNR